jgi:hypothetical protein
MERLLVHRTGHELAALHAVGVQPLDVPAERVDLIDVGFRVVCETDTSVTNNQ